MSLCFLTAEAMQPAASCSHHWELVAMMNCIPLDCEPEIIPFPGLLFARYFITTMIKVTNTLSQQVLLGGFGIFPWRVLPPCWLPLKPDRCPGAPWPLLKLRYSSLNHCTSWNHFSTTADPHSFLPFAESPFVKQPCTKPFANREPRSLSC